MPVNPKRVKILVDGEIKKEACIYWMSRDQRVKDNWALLFAQDLAKKSGSPIAVIFCLLPEFLGATSRQYKFMLQGLKEVEKNLKQLNIPFILLKGNPKKEILQFLSTLDAGALVTDFSPIRISRD
jgi:deoxyribodipyrimidine photo-lyase